MSFSIGMNIFEEFCNKVVEKGNEMEVNGGIGSRVIAEELKKVKNKCKKD